MNATACDILFQSLSPEMASAVADFFHTLDAWDFSRFFHPHPFTAAEARLRCDHSGADIYRVAVVGGRIVAYGMLRGWDAGYAVPSLGIAVHPEAQGRGIGRAMVHHLHDLARLRGAQRVRLKVYRQNLAALKLYQQLGYQFTDEQGDQLIGHVELKVM